MRVIRLGLTALSAALLVVASVAAWASDATDLPAAKRTKAELYLGAEEVPGFLAQHNGRVLFIDVRTPAELMFVGNTPLMDANIPVKLGPTATFDEQKAVFALQPNPRFVAEVEARLAGKSLAKSDPVIVMCRSGDRSAIAANLLTDAGFGRVYSVVDGFEGDLAKDGPEAGHHTVNGWKNKRQPWGYALDKGKMSVPLTAPQ